MDAHATTGIGHRARGLARWSMIAGLLLAAGVAVWTSQHGHGAAPREITLRID